MVLLKMVLLAMVVASATDAQERTALERAAVRATFGDDQIRVHVVSLAPGERTELRDHTDALLIRFSADLDGSATADPVTWHRAGATTLENRSAMPYSALLVELIAPRSGVGFSLPPEVTVNRVAELPTLFRLDRYAEDERRVRTLIDNSRVLVTAHRLPDWAPRTEPRHWHSREVVLVYLAGGEITGSTGQLGARRVRRGDFDVLPANLPHVFQNVGNQPIEFVMITPK